MKRTLTAQQRLFVHEFLVDRNATAAAKRAGYSKQTARQQGARLLSVVAIRSAIDAGLKKLTEKTDVSVERVVLELARILEADPVDAINDDGTVKPLREWPEDLRRALAGMDIEEVLGPSEERGEQRPVVGFLRKYKFWSKTEASQQLLRKLGAFKDTVEVRHSLYDLIAQAEDNEDDGE